MSFPVHFLDQIRSNVLISEVIGRSVTLKRAGREFHACCPFHNEKSPSFTVNDQKAFYHCFGCGAHGDVIKFLMDQQNMGFVEAVKMLADEAGLQVPELKQEDKQKADISKIYYEIMEKATAFFEAQLFGDQAKNAQDYFKNRGLTGKICKAFRLGYAPANGRLLYEHLRGFGYEQQHLIDLGLIRISERNGEPYSFFRDRIIFPVLNKQSKVVAFGGRLMAGEGPKYINSPETPIFHKGHIVYGIDRAAKAISKGERFIVCEGYMDVIALNRAGYHAAVAPLGTALTEDQIDLLWKLGKYGGGNPILCFDGDNAGIRAAYRAIDRILPILTPSHSIDLIFMSPGYDPDSLFKEQGKPAIDALLSNPQKLSDVLWQALLAQNPMKTPEDKAYFKQSFQDKCREIKDVSLQRSYISDFFDRLKALNQQMRDKKFSGKPLKQAFHQGYRKQLDPNFQARFKQILYLLLLCTKPGSIDDEMERVGAVSFSDPQCEHERHALIEAYEESHHNECDAHFTAERARIRDVFLTDDRICGSLKIYASDLLKGEYADHYDELLASVQGELQQAA